MHRRTLSLTPPPLSSTRGRLIVTISILVLSTIVYLITPKSTITTLKHHIPGAYPYVKPPSHAIYTPTPDPPSRTPPPEQLIIKAQLEGEDLNWLLKLRPAWRNQVITLDASFAHLHADAKRVDKGRIVNAFLMWIIANYDNLSAVMVFVPPRLAEQEQDAEAWRIPHKETVQHIQDLNVAYVQSEGYAPLGCPTKAECEDAVLPFRDPPDEFRALEVNMAKAWRGLFNSTEVPHKLARSGGSAFAVSKTQIRRRSVEEWTRYWDWLANTKMDDDSAGNVVEALWHVIFGREGTWCPSEDACKCDVFGEC